MIFNYLIFLCIGTYVSCLPIEKFTNALLEAKSFGSSTLAQMENNVQNPLVDIPETLTDDCIKNNLEIFAKSLEQVSQFVPNRSFTVLIMRLNEEWPKQEKKSENCATSQGGPKQLVSTLTNHVIEWHHYLEKKNAI